MKDIVRKDPVKAVGKAVRKVREAAADEYGEDEDFYQHLDAELGTDSAIEKQLLRVRLEVIGQTPKSMNEFQPFVFLERIYGENNIIVCDSNQLKEDWRKRKNNPNSEYNWSKLTDEMRNIDEEFHDENVSDDIEMNEEVIEEDITDKNLPKRVLAFTSKKLLYQLSRNLKSSVDGTFKLSCAEGTGCQLCGVGSEISVS